MLIKTNLDFENIYARVLDIVKQAKMTKNKFLFFFHHSWKVASRCFCFSIFVCLKLFNFYFYNYLMFPIASSRAF